MFQLSNLTRSKIQLSIVSALALGSLYHAQLHGMASFNPYDPLPFFSSANPHEFLQTSQKEKKLGYVPEIKSERANITISPFAQWANTAETEHKDHVPLGDIHGPWNMLGLLYNSSDCLVSCSQGDLTAIQEYNALSGQLFSTFDGSAYTFGNPLSLTTTSVEAAVGPNFGLVSVPLRYRKAGVRGEMAVRVLQDVGLKLQVGFADVQQVLTQSLFIDLGFGDANAALPIAAVADNNATNTPLLFNQSLLHSEITGTNAIPKVAGLFGINTCDYKKAGIEDLKLQLFWRHAFAFNERSAEGPEDWPRFLLTPFLQIIGAIGVAEFKDQNKALGVALNNDGHDAIGFNTGVCLDFQESLELAVEGGGTFFSRECHFMRVPTSPLQAGVFPCTTRVNYKPGNTWHLIGTLHARRFIDKLSSHIQFVLINHEEDEFHIRQSSCGPFYPEILRCQSKWSMSLFNAAFNYDISPNISLGVLWQVPMKRRNTPKCKTLIGSIVANF